MLRRSPARPASATDLLCGHREVAAVGNVDSAHVRARYQEATGTATTGPLAVRLAGGHQGLQEYLRIDSMAAVIYASPKGYQIVVRPYSLQNSDDDFYLLQNDSISCLRPIPITYIIRPH